jgi:hypothetical protein
LTLFLRKQAKAFTSRANWSFLVLCMSVFSTGYTHSKSLDKRITPHLTCSQEGSFLSLAFPVRTGQQEGGVVLKQVVITADYRKNIFGQMSE